MAAEGERCTVRVGFVLRSSSRWTAVAGESKQRRRLTGELSRSLTRLETIAAPVVSLPVDARAPAG